MKRDIEKKVSAKSEDHSDIDADEPEVIGKRGVEEARLKAIELIKSKGESNKKIKLKNKRTKTGTEDTEHTNKVRAGKESDMGKAKIKKLPENLNKKLKTEKKDKGVKVATDKSAGGRKPQDINLALINSKRKYRDNENGSGKMRERIVGGKFRVTTLEANNDIIDGKIRGQELSSGIRDSSCFEERVTRSLKRKKY